MLEESGRVVAVDSRGVWVESDRTGTCQACSASKGCGQRALAEYAARRSERLCIENPLGITATVGDLVTVGIAEDSFLRASLLLYTLPLLLLFLGGYLGSMYSETELPAILGSLCGLMIGLMVARGLGQRLAKSCRYQPILINVL